MKILLVFAHPEPKSFGARMLATACATLRQDGHDVAVSDLYAMRFNPVASAEDFTTRRFPDIRYWNEPTRVGHFAAFEQPALFVEALVATVRRSLNLFPDMITPGH